MWTAKRVIFPEATSENRRLLGNIAGLALQTALKSCVNLIFCAWKKFIYFTCPTSMKNNARKGTFFC